MTKGHVGAFFLTLVLTLFVGTPTVATSIVSFPLTAHTEQNYPSYAKWGKQAMVEVKKKYPHAEIYDYKHVGRQEQGNMSTETFFLWIREQKTSTKIKVNITFDSNSQHVTTIDVQPMPN